MTDTILVLNGGSSSIKFQLYEIRPNPAPGDDGLDRRFKGQLDGIGTSLARLLARDGENRALIDRPLSEAEAADVETAQAALGRWLEDQVEGKLIAVGHRVVHGGADFPRPVLVDDTVLEKITALIPLAPLHQPHNIAPIRSIRARKPGLPQVACFDTSFHRAHPDIADRFAIPERLYREGVRRYGFHGLSYEFISGRLPLDAPEIAHGRVVVAHLGSGASACAMQDGRSMESTMGFTALDGLPMGTRPGALDPGVVLYLQQQGMAAKDIERLLYHECGLLGLSGISNDVRDLEASDAPAARLALDYFAYHTARAVAALASAMGGLDGIVFTAGVGENAAPVRAAIGARCAWLGVAMDAARNEANGPRISADNSRIPVYVIPTNEERMIARHTLALLGETP